MLERPVFKFSRAVRMAGLTFGGLSFNLQHTQIVLALARPLGGRIAAQIVLEGEVKPTSRKLPLAPLQVSATFDYYFSELLLKFTNFPSLGDLLRLVELDPEVLPAPLSQLLNVRLTHLTLAVDLQKKSVSAVSFRLETAQEVDLVKNLISLKPRLSMEIVWPLDTERCSIQGELQGEWLLDGVRFSTRVSYPSCAFSAALEQTVSTKKVVDHLLPGIDLPELEVTEATLEGNVLNGSYFAVITADFMAKKPSQPKRKTRPWSLNPKYLSIIELAVAYADQQVTHCHAKLTLQLPALMGTNKKGGIELAAEYVAGREGLQFSGQTTSAITIQTLIDNLTEIFWLDQLQFPPLLETFSVSALQVSFNTQREDFTFLCDGTLRINKTNVAATVTLDHKPKEKTRFRGLLTLGKGLQFGLVFSNSADQTYALATYHNVDGETQTIAEIFGPIMPDSGIIPSSLRFGLQDALLGYSKSTVPGDAAKSKGLFGVDIEGGLNLSDLKLKDFPLLGQSPLPPDQTLKLAVQITGANGQFSLDDIKALNALNSGATRLPHRVIDGLAVAVSLRLGREAKQISLPIGLKEPASAPDHTSTSPVRSNNNFLTDAEKAAVKSDTPHSSAQAVTADGMQWMKIQKSFGPVHIERVGVGYSNDKIIGLLDAALSAGGLTIALDGLSVTSPLTRLEPEFDLRGLGIDYRNGPLEIGGSFLKMKDSATQETSFAGLAMLRTPQLSLSAIGSYALKDGHPSLFIYAVLDYPLGGPSFFFVTGLAGGFGYNRALTLPVIEDVESHPLVRQATQGSQQVSKRKDWKPPAPLPTDRKAQQELLTERLGALEQYIPPAVGEHFLAMGLRFTSFKRVDSFALLAVKFGKELEFDLLGLSTLEVPSVAYARLALKATFNPQTGFLGVASQLMSNSYLFSGACRLTGGSAFYTWFKDLEEGGKKIIGGDFVLTLGGYHPNYEPPAHYPRVPRLGFNWMVDDYLQLKGDAYYAMTPQALMAGGHLEATWQKDPFKAWFNAGVDFLMLWQPYHYDARLYVNMGASYTFDLFGSHTLTAELGADVHLWGPEFSGEAHVHLSIISFTINFGNAQQLRGIEPIPWSAFKEEFLPRPDEICGIAVQAGLVRQTTAKGENDYWIVNPKEFVLVTNSVIPSTHWTLGSSEHQSQPETRLAVRPAAVDKGKSTHHITITHNGQLVSDKFRCDPVFKAVPAALWGAPEFTDSTKDLPAGERLLKEPHLSDEKSMVENTLAGLTLRPPTIGDAQGGEEVLFTPKAYECDRVSNMFVWNHWKHTGTDEPDDQTPESDKIGNRNAILDILFENRILMSENGGRLVES